MMTRYNLLSGKLKEGDCISVDDIGMFGVNLFIDYDFDVEEQIGIFVKENGFSTLGFLQFLIDTELVTMDNDSEPYRGCFFCDKEDLTDIFSKFRAGREEQILKVGETLEINGSRYGQEYPQTLVVVKEFDFYGIFELALKEFNEKRKEDSPEFVDACEIDGEIIYFYLLNNGYIENKDSGHTLYTLKVYGPMDKLD